MDAASFPEMPAGHYHIFSRLCSSQQSVCQARRDPSPTELHSKEAESCSKFILDASSVGLMYLSYRELCSVIQS